MPVKPSISKYKVNSLLSLFQPETKREIINKLSNKGMSIHTINMIRQVGIESDYSPNHSNLQKMVDVLKKYNPVFKIQLNIKINTTDDLLNRHK